ncbi:MAG: hypothetical protein PUC08_02290 [Bacteroidales bacterium]|nr:hypothetical protein [Bacteroidales bacterium]
MQNKVNYFFLLLLSNIFHSIPIFRKALQKVCKNDTYFNARSMDVYITKLRKYLRRDPYVDIVNQHGVGFKLAFVPK